MIRAVFFDAVGTLIEPIPSPVEVYLEAGRRHGSRLGRDEIASRFRAAFVAEDEVDRANAWRTDEERERNRWRSVVGHVLDDVGDPSACFAELWAHFARPDAWRCREGTGELLRKLALRGYRLGMASNFDGRLHGIVTGLPELRPLAQLLVSSEVGWRKPSPHFFEQLVSAAEAEPSDILFVGDDPINDDEGGRAAGLTTLLLDPRGGEGTLRSLADLLERLP